MPLLHSYCCSYPQWVFIEIWGLSFDHFDGHDAQGPDINFGSICFSRHHLWGHPVWRAHHRTPLTLLWSDLSAEPKISCGTKQLN